MNLTESIHPQHPPSDKETKQVDSVKCHALAIKQHMEDLAHHAASDEMIRVGVTNFFSEVASNILRMLADAASHLPRRADDKPYFSIEYSEIRLLDSEDTGAQGDPAVKKNELATL